MYGLTNKKIMEKYINHQYNEKFESCDCIHVNVPNKCYSLVRPLAIDTAMLQAHKEDIPKYNLINLI